MPPRTKGGTPPTSHPTPQADLTVVPDTLLVEIDKPASGTGTAYIINQNDDWLRWSLEIGRNDTTLPGNGSTCSFVSFSQDSGILTAGAFDAIAARASVAAAL